MEKRGEEGKEGVKRKKKRRGGRRSERWTNRKMEAEVGIRMAVSKDSIKLTR